MNMKIDDLKLPHHVRNASCFTNCGHPERLRQATQAIMLVIYFVFSEPLTFHVT